MSDAELLRFGMVAKYMCSQEANPEHTSREDFVLQLKEAQRESGTSDLQRSHWLLLLVEMSGERTSACPAKTT
jgi:hypothetical protein